MKLYDSQGAPNPRRVKLFLAEKNLKVDVIQVPIGEGAHKQPEYRKIASNGKLPAFETDAGDIILETQSICLYLEHLHPTPNLLGESPLEKAQIDMWSRRAEGELMMPLAHAFRHTHPAMAALENQFAEFGEANKKGAARGLKTFDALVGDKDFMLGDRLTNVDLVVLSIVDFFPRLSRVEFTQETNPNLYRWLQSMKARESYRSSLEA